MLRCMINQTDGASDGKQVLVVRALQILYEQKKTRCYFDAYSISSKFATVIFQAFTQTISDM